MVSPFLGLEFAAFLDDIAERALLTLEMAAYERTALAQRIKP